MRIHVNLCYETSCDKRTKNQNYRVLVKEDGYDMINNASRPILGHHLLSLLASLYFLQHNPHHHHQINDGGGSFQKFHALKSSCLYQKSANKNIGEENKT